jgi:hypothetical protein
MAASSVPVSTAVHLLTFEAMARVLRLLHFLFRRSLQSLQGIRDALVNAVIAHTPP